MTKEVSVEEIMGDYLATNKAEIDVSYDAPVGDFMKWVETYNLEQRLIKAQGPGGGNPCFEVSTKNRDDLLNALTEHYGGVENIPADDIYS